MDAARLGRAEFWLAHRDYLAAHLRHLRRDASAIDSSADANSVAASVTALEEFSLTSIADDQNDIVRG